MTPAFRATVAVAGALLAGAGSAAQGGDAPAKSGAALFQTHCAQCHGTRGDGQGALAPRFDPRPSNLAASPRTDDYRLQIITVGGGRMGRSAVMPEWGLELSDTEIVALVTYLRELSNQHAASRAPDRGSSRVEAAQPHG